jgi:Helix-turn-helix domain
MVKVEEMCPRKRREAPGGAGSSGKLLFPLIRQIEKAAGTTSLTRAPPLWGILTPQSAPPQNPKGEIVAKAQRFTRIPKMQYFIKQGIPLEVIPTYCALSDYTNNRSGLCWPKMETLAQTLNRSVRTIQRHIHLLARLGLIELVERRRYKGRFSSYLYRVLHIASTTGHQRPMDKRFLYRTRTKDLQNCEKPEESREERREREARRRREGYEWLFDR